VGSNSEIQGYKVYPMLHFCRKFSSSVTPESIISDRDPQFAAGIMKELNKLLGINTKLSMAFHPQTDGQTERINQELEQYLRMFIDY